MRRPLVLAISLLVAAGSLSAQQPSRLDPRLRLPLLRAGGTPSDTMPGAADARYGPGLAALAVPHAGTGPDGLPLIRALARLGPGGAAALERAGARIGARAGDVVSVRLPARSLAALGAEPAVRFLEAAAWLEPSRPAPALAAPVRAIPPANDSAASEIGVETLRHRSGDRFYGLAGQGVVVGVVDTGLDLGHEDFRGPDGRSRVVFAWDQTATGGRPPGAAGESILDYGVECTGAEIDAGRCPLGDDAGHGTHVAGTAAGDGSATGNGLPAYRYAGVAPAADLIVVRAGQTGFTSDRLLDGVAYILERAAALGRPVVVNLSVSTQSGPHDGTTLLERALDQLSGPGRIIVAGAGNQGVNANEEPAFVRAPSHAMGRIGAGTSSHTLIVPVYTPRPDTINDGAVLELWYDGLDSLAVTVTTPGGVATRVVTGDTILAETPGGAVAIDNAFGGPQATNGDHLALIALVDLDEAVPPDSGRWTIAVERTGGTGPGDYHLWLIGATFSNPTALARLDGGTTNTHLVGSPATADRVLAVAGYASRHYWRGAEGEVESFPVREPRGDIAFFSSPGPRRDGVLKPEIAAPAKMVVSARARNGATWEASPWLVEEDGVHAALLGTSMAAPFVTGAVALLLQLDATLTPERARELLTGAARRDAFTRSPRTGEPQGVPNAQWGHGKLDVGEAVRWLRTGGNPPDRNRVALSANPVRGTELVVHHSEKPSAVAVYTFTGELVRSFGPGEIGEYLTVWDLVNGAGRAVANGAYLLVVDLPAGRVLEKIFVVRP